MLDERTPEIQLPPADLPDLPYRELPDGLGDDYVIAVSDAEFESIRQARSGNGALIAEELVREAVCGDELHSDEQAALIRAAALVAERWPELLEMAVDSLALRRQMTRRH